MNIFIAISSYGSWDSNREEILCVKDTREKCEIFIQEFEKLNEIIKNNAPISPHSDEFMEYQIDNNITDDEYDKVVKDYYEYESKYPQLDYNKSYIQEHIVG